MIVYRHRLFKKEEEGVRKKGYAYLCSQQFLIVVYCYQWYYHIMVMGGASYNTNTTSGFETGANDR